MKSFRTLLLAAFLLASFSMTAKAQDENPAKASAMALHGITQNFISATAEMLDEDMYAYRPSVNVRTAGQILAHIANAQFGICSTAAGEDNPAEGNYEEIATTKADISAALAASFEYCGSVYKEMTAEKAGETKPFIGGNPMTVGAILAFNSMHNYEHYGNLVTYMRINGITPPSSAGGM